MESPIRHSTQLLEEISDLALETESSVAVAESLTGGLLASHLASSHDASEWFLGGVVAYHEAVKHKLLDIDDAPVVSAEAAISMADSVTDLTGAQFGVGITGVGGPGSQEGNPAGTVYIALHAPNQPTQAKRYRFIGNPSDVLSQMSRVCSEARSLCDLLRAARTYTDIRP